MRKPVSSKKRGSVACALAGDAVVKYVASRPSMSVNDSNRERRTWASKTELRGPAYRPPNHDGREL